MASESSVAAVLVACNLFVVVGFAIVFDGDASLKFEYAGSTLVPLNVCIGAFVRCGSVGRLSDGTASSTSPVLYIAGVR